MLLIPSLVAYLAVAVFVVAVVARFLMWSRMPMHLRWELYPVAHEGGGRAAYGGSYLEESGWWNKPREISLAGELGVMVPEMVFLVALREHNKKLWLRSFPFHFGLYIVFAATALMVGRALLAVVAPGVLEGGLGALLQWAILACGVGGSALTVLGAIGLLQRRLSDAGMRRFSSPADYANLILFVLAFGLALLHVLLVDPDMSRSAAVVQALVTFRPASAPGGILTAATVVSLSLLVAYIPLTHMSHFVGKYFAYHAIRWNDTPNLKGGPEEAVIGELLQRPITWAAPHISGGEKTTWAGAATKVRGDES